MSLGPSLFVSLSSQWTFSWILFACAFLVALSISLLCVAAHRLARAKMPVRSGPTQVNGVPSALSTLSCWLSRINRPMLRPWYESRLNRNLIKAGQPRDLQPQHILTLQELGLAAGLAVGLASCMGGRFHPLWSLVFGALGGALPLLWLRDQVKKRLLLVSRALPYHLDLLTLAVEAGLDFTGALGKVVERGRSGPLRDELQLVLKQLRVGRTREEALKGMIARVDLPQLTQFIRALIQADKMGTSLGKVLRIQSAQMRVERTQRAEKLANQAPVKMLFPLVACIFPTVFMILFGPIVFALMFGG
jgi:tight adherence protein C